MQTDSSNKVKKNVDMSEIKNSIKDLIFPIKINDNSNDNNETQNLQKFKKLIFKPENETKTNPFILEMFYHS